MEYLTSLIPNITLAMSMLATLAVVFVTVLRALAGSFSRKTAAVLALGVTIVAVVGTTEIILGPVHMPPPAGAPYAKGSAVMLLPFVSLAVALLLSQLLSTAAKTPPRGQTRAAMQQTGKARVKQRPPDGKIETATSTPSGRLKKAQRAHPKGQNTTAPITASTASAPDKQS